jgi:hypothetical protein
VAPPANAADGVNVATVPLPFKAAEPGTATPEPSFKVNTNDDDDTASENVADGATDVDTPVAPLPGTCDVTEGGVVSAGAVVVKIGSIQ